MNAIFAIDKVLKSALPSKISTVATPIEIFVSSSGVNSAFPVFATILYLTPVVPTTRI